MTAPRQAVDLESLLEQPAPVFLPKQAGGREVACVLPDAACAQLLNRLDGEVQSQDPNQLATLRAIARRLLPDATDAELDACPPAFTFLVITHVTGTLRSVQEALAGNAGAPGGAVTKATPSRRSKRQTRSVGT